MSISSILADMEGVHNAAVMMANDINKGILQDAGLLTDTGLTATANDLFIAVMGESESFLIEALKTAEKLITEKQSSDDTSIYKASTIQGAIALEPDINLAVISVPGQYAASEAWKALNRGLHVFLFSDNVSIEDEVSLKLTARKRNLLLMGPGAGTAILNGNAIGFGNSIPSGPIGLVSASGTGLQEVSTLLARYNSGISQAIGVGGRDLSEEVGGLMTIEALKALQNDKDTDIIILISKPPHYNTKRRVETQVQKSDKPTIICFLGSGKETSKSGANVTYSRSLQECALYAAKQAGVIDDEVDQILFKENLQLKLLAEQIKNTQSRLSGDIRGLFSGGTLCYEALSIWRDIGLPDLFSNLSLEGINALPNPNISIRNCAVDLGEEEFTIGRPHPMINYELRNRRLLQEMQDPDVRVIMLDVVLGFGAHPDPASELAKGIERANNIAQRSSDDITIVASVTGTDNDPQSYRRSVSILENSGAVLCDSNASAAKLSALLVSGK